MQNKKIRKRKKGATSIMEILIVIALSALLFISQIPSIGNYMNKGNEAGTRTVISDYQRDIQLTLMEKGFSDKGDAADWVDVINANIDPKLKFIPTWNTTENGYLTTKLDRQGNPYILEFYQNGKKVTKPGELDNFTVSAAVGKEGEALNTIVVRSKGINTAEATDDIVLVSFYGGDGYDVYTKGFSSSNMESFAKITVGSIGSLAVA